MNSEAAFRREVREWLNAHCPKSMRSPGPASEDVWGGRNCSFANDDCRVWFERMVEKGWTAPSWPIEFGGAGLSDVEVKILEEELAALQCRVALKSFGIWMLGPVLLNYGTDEQKRSFLGPIARGETRWCQGYSEPEAGSDLASLKCGAVRDGDEFVVTGQKIWTSHADQADWMFCLVRTDAKAQKRDGISFLLIDMSSPGIKAKPINLISGSSIFCEVFFDDVRVPADNLVGPLNGGWTIAKELLGHERTLISKLRDANSEEEATLVELAKRYLKIEDGRLADADLRHRIAQVEMDFICNKLTLRRSNEAMMAGKGPGPESSMFKLYGTELNKRKKELRVLVSGYQGLGWDGENFETDELSRTREWLRSRANSIEGGTSEIQMNIIAKRVLGLPS